MQIRTGHIAVLLLIFLAMSGPALAQDIDAKITRLEELDARMERTAPTARRLLLASLLYLAVLIAAMAFDKAPRNAIAELNQLTINSTPIIQMWQEGR